MGTLRILIALAVLIGHYKFYFPHSYIGEILPYLRGAGIDGAMKVNCFFIIAGFYSQLMMEEKFLRTHNLAVRFYLYRLVRLMPVYYLVLFLTVCLWWYASAQPSWNPQNTLWMKDLNRVTQMQTPTGLADNLFLFISAVFKFSDFIKYEVELHLAVWHAWALTIEILFILIAPFFLKGKKRFWFISALSVALALYYAQSDIVRNYFGASLIYFMAGCIGYKYYRTYLYDRPFSLNAALVAYVLVMIAALVLIYFTLLAKQFGIFNVYWAFMIGFALCLPFIAVATRGLKYDRFVGELAYPIYLCHYLFIFLANILEFYSPFTIVFVIVGCLIFSAGCHFYINQPLAEWRRKKLL